MRIRSYIKYRRMLAYGWIFFFLACLSICLFIYSKDWIDDATFKDMLQQLSKIYLPLLGAILTFYWTKRTSAHTPDLTDATGLAVAGICSFIWNSLILFFLIPLAFRVGSASKAISNIDFIKSTFSWLVAGSIGYYFAKESALPSK